MHLADLKQKTIADLNDVARELKIEGAANLRKQELIFAILQAQTEKNGVVFGEGVLETLPDLTPATELLREAFDMLEEDFEEERFFVAVRRAYWGAAEGSPARKIAASLIDRLEF